MILTNVVADDNKKAHKAAAYTAFASYATAVIVFLSFRYEKIYSIIFLSELFLLSNNFNA